MKKKPKLISRQKKQGKSVPKTIRSSKIVNKSKPVTGMFWKSSLDAVTDAVCFLDPDQRILHCNRVMTEMFGLTQKEIIGKHCWEIVHGTTKPFSKCPATRAKKSFARENGEIRKGKRWFNIIADPIVDKKGKIKGVIHTLQDITKHKSTIQNLQESENKYRELVEHVSEVIFSVDMQGFITYISPAMEHLTGYSTSGVIGTNITEHIIPEDLPKVLASINRILVSSEKESVEYRIKIKNGEIRHVVSSSNVIFKDGQPAGLTGSITDITQRKLAENALKEAELKFRTIFDSASDGILLAEVGSRNFISANKSICKMLGYTKKDIVKLNVSDIHPKESLSYVIDQFEKLSRKEISIARDIPLMKKNKTLFFTDVNTSSIVLDGKECLIGMFRDTTQRKRSEEELRESEKKYKFLTETISDIIWIMDLNLRTTYVSPSIRRVLGFSQEERLRQTVYEQLTPDSLSAAKKILEDELALEKQGKTDPQRAQTLILEFYHKDGSTRWLENTINGIRNEQGILTGLHGVSRDITERKRAEEALKERDIVFKKLSANVPGIIYQFMMKPDGTFCIPFSTEAVKDIYGCAPEDIVNDFSPILKVIHNEDTDRFIQSIKCSAKNMTSWQCEYRVQVPGKPLRWLLGTSTPEKLPDGSIIWHGFNTDITERKKAEEELFLIKKAVEDSSDAIGVSDPQGHHFYQNKAFSDLFEYATAEELEAAGGGPAAFANKDTASEVFESIMSGNSWQGEITMISKSGRKFPVQIRADAIKDEAGKIIGLIGIHTDITERKLAEEALKRSEEDFRSLFEQSIDGITINDPSSIIEANYAFSVISGYPVEKTIGMKPLDFIHPDDREIAAQRLQQRLKGMRSPEGYIYRAIRADGSISLVDLRSRLIEWKDKPAFLTIIRDITEMKQAEEALRASEEKYRGIFDESITAIYIFDTKKNFIDSNQAGLDLLGYSKEELMRMSIPDVDDDPVNVLPAHQELFDGGRLINYEHKLRRKDGSIITVLNNSRPLTDSQGNIIGMLSTLIDITERKQAEAEIAVLSNALKLALDPILIVDLEGKVISANEAAKKLFETEDLGVSALDYVAPEDKERVTSTMQELLMGSGVNVTEFTVITKSGRRVFIEATGNLIVDANGKANGIVVVERDITDRKRMEAALRDSETKLKAVIQGSPVPQFVIDQNHKILYWNKALEEISGIKSADILGTNKHWQAFYHNERPCLADLLVDQQINLIPELYKGNCNESNYSEGAYEAEGFFPIMGKEGKWLFFGAALIRDAHGNIIGSVETLEDITERKKAEDALQKEFVRLQTMVSNAPVVIFAVDKHGIFILSEGKALSTMGLKGGEVVGRSVFDVYRDHPDDQEHFRRALQGEAFTALVSVGDRFFEAYHEPILTAEGKFDGSSGILVDVTERKKAEEELKRSIVLNKAILESVPGILYLYDNAGHLVHWNKQHEELTGYSGDEINGRYILDWFGDIEPDTSSIKKGIADVMNNGHATAEGRLITKDGRAIPMIFTGVKLTIANNNYLLGVGIDITERMKAEKELEKYREHLEELVRERTIKLEASNKELEAFSYSASHDLRAPLRSIEGFSQALLEDYCDKLDIQGKDYLTRIKTATRRMADLIEDMLQLSRITRMEMNIEKINLTVIARSVMSELQKSQPQRHVEISIADSLEDTADLRLMRIVLDNLLSNAWKFTERQTKAKIEFGLLKAEGGGKVYFIRDNGAGFDMAYADKLFAPFQRLHADDEFPGTGIGLATVRRIINRHGGKVWAEGEIDKGATFYFSLNEK
ncbi:MAG: hypothetical protein CVU62_04850 [Deltaproteobacteria bacterium HGW-Deltaproteobacteria-2]|jgi:PAS domain S-box-containing protein|nr:MAG: hypothetical protein CVU62_04850 [Deltaproteobacteria bacterium HGW-Deltaproteobacteria-2]